MAAVSLAWPMYGTLKQNSSSSNFVVISTVSSFREVPQWNDTMSPRGIRRGLGMSLRRDTSGPRVTSISLSSFCSRTSSGSVSLKRPRCVRLRSTGPAGARKDSLRLEVLPQPGRLVRGPLAPHTFSQLVEPFGTSPMRPSFDGSLVGAFD
jgi:hypothetical protein